MKHLIVYSASVVLLIAPDGSVADVVKLRSGGEIRGIVVESAGESPGEPQSDAGPGEEEQDSITIETLTGGLVSVARSDVAFVTRRPRIFEEYEVKARGTADTAEAQWELAEWCRVNGLDDERQEHLQRVVALDRNHEQARAALGQTLYQGEWLTREEIMRDRGLVEHKGRWITPEELELIEKTDAEREREQAWFTEIRKYRGWLRGTSDDLRRRAIAELKRIDDPHAVKAMEYFFRDDPDHEIRSFYVSLLAEMTGIKPVKPLVTQALHDVHRQVRELAFDAIDESRYEAALPYFLEGLQSDQNLVVRRAGRGLEKVGDERAIPDLIKALITTHRYRIRVPESSPVISFSGDGTFGVGGVPLPPDIAGALRTGALPHGVIVVDPTKPVRTRVVTISVNEENPEVLSALRAITGETFGFDERTWRLWWAAKKNGAG